ncbi:RNA-directed DNA polymerase (Reverse transcriptase) [Trifolium medium]|uniref:RNA-directed DNA polymerase (Reverse transcriptase) n=1 Tax=Trifolium medium TaxID=97028 RepID=A0A392M0R6_9FABA|nr:RNA-directed DNA polymerase (Reverse transcriptase) [Trifolium medium]
MECVRSATTSVLVNGSPIDEYWFGRGLRQGDPLSPFLFLIVAEGLNVMMKASVEANLFKGYILGESSAGIILSIESLFKAFLWGRSEEVRKINWINWDTVLVFKYGMEDDRVKGGGRMASAWWKDLCQIRDGVGENVGHLFENNLRRTVGNGENTIMCQ